MATNEQSTAYQVVARRFRPRAFAEVVGQDEVLHSLAHALDSGRIPHAFLFAGSRGVGKTTTARIFARCLNCEKGPTSQPCGTCEPCRSILEERNVDFVEIDAASHNSVEDVRELRERVGFASMGSRYKVYLLDEAHMMSKSAFNAFLKTLEEPPPRVVFIMATTELQKVPDTIRSRCQVLQFRQVAPADIVRRLQHICGSEGVQLGDGVLEEIARSASGGLRDAETTLERVLAVAKAEGATFTLDAYRRLFHRIGFDEARAVVQGLVDGEAGPALRFVQGLVDSGGDEREALGEVLDVLRALLLLVVDGKETPLVALGDREDLFQLAQRAGVERLDAMLQAGLVGRERIRMLEDRRLVLELTFVRMARAGALPLLADLAAAVSAGHLTAAPVAAGPAKSGPVRSGPGSAALAKGAPARAVVAPDDLAGRLRQWAEKNKPMLVSTIEACRISGPDESGVVTFALESERKMHRDRLQSDGGKQLLKQALADVLGKPVGVAVAGAAPATGPTAPSGPVEGAPEPGEAVQRVAKRFDGRIVRSEERAPE
ncbi:MAG: DNA polymerase III subunit gamma/tau [Planctomycetota bacterium]